MKVVINKCYGGFALSKEGWKLYWEMGGKARRLGRKDRADPLLVAVVEKLDWEADGLRAELKIVEIPDGIEWAIEESDGIEWVAEVHRRWA